MINVLFVTYGLEKNGTEEFVMNVLRSLDKKNYHADFLLFSQGETDNSREAEGWGCKIFRLPPRAAGLSYYSKLNQFFRDNAHFYNAVHWNEGCMSTIMPIYYAWKYNVPVRIIHAHNSNTTGWLNKIQHYVNKIFGLKYCTHRFACSSLAAEFFFNNDKTVIIKNGIVVDRFLFNEKVRNEIRRNIGVSEDTILVGHVGRFTKVKNQMFVLDIFIELLSRNINSKLVLIGSGDLFDFIKKKVTNENIEKFVLMVGTQNNVNEWMQAFDIFLMPSLYEGFPFVLVEAQSASLPCLVSDTVNKEVAITDQVRFISLNERASVWANNLLDMIKNNKRKNNLSIIQSSGYSISSTVRYLENVYKGE